MNCFLIAAERGAARVQALVRLAEGLGYTVLYAADFAALNRDRAFTEARRPLVLVPEGEGAAEGAIQLARAEPSRALCSTSSCGPFPSASSGRASTTCSRTRATTSAKA